MNFYLIGIDYKRADIVLREMIYARRNEIFSVYKNSFAEGALFSTCNRIEIYIADSDIGANFLAAPEGWYIFSDKARALRHALRLAVGLESQLKGETQILGQIDSWRSGLSVNLFDFWKRVYSQAVEIRGICGLDRQVYDIGDIVFADIRKNFVPGRQLKIIVAGTGRIAEALARQRRDFTSLGFAAHKNISRAKELAGYAQGQALSLRDLMRGPLEADVLISATSSPHHIFKKEDIARISLGRKRHLYIYDLAVPRDVEPETGAIEGVTLKNLDDLSAIFAQYNKGREQQFDLAEKLIEEKVKKI